MQHVAKNDEGGMVAAESIGTHIEALVTCLPEGGSVEIKNYGKVGYVVLLSFRRDEWVSGRAPSLTVLGALQEAASELVRRCHQRSGEERARLDVLARVCVSEQ